MAHARSKPGYILKAWLDRIEADSGPVEQRLVKAAVDLVETTCARPQGLEGALFRFGNTLGADGWQSAQVSEWLGALRECVSRKQAKQLAQYSSHAAVAKGWAEGFVRGAHAGMWIDPTTGLVTAMVLQLRLEEVYQQCLAIGVLPCELYSLIIIDFDTRDSARLDADLIAARVADSVVGAFREGETIARAGDRILVLAAAADATQQRIDALAAQLGSSASTRRARATVMVDSLPARPELLGRYLHDLVG